MGKVFIEESTLSAIGDAIRGKTGGTELIAVPSMADEITAITTGGSDLPEEALVISGNCSYRFANGGWDWFVEEYGNRITTKDISNATYMFQNSKLKEIPFTINFSNISGLKFSRIFYLCGKLEKVPILNVPNAEKIDMSEILYACMRLRDANGLFENEEEFGALFQSYINTGSSNLYLSKIFQSCYSLRTVPSWLYLLKLNPESTAYPTNNYGLYNYLFSGCYALDEVLDLPVWKCKGTITNNMFNSTFSSCHRIKNATFETNADGSPIVTEWKTQTIDLSSTVGYTGFFSNYTGDYNHGITADKEVTDAATYEALKNDKDWFTKNKAYSRYNHDSAVNTINSLPDTSAYLATAGGTNTIKFNGANGSATDGGAINTLTAEEIAVAAAKGWTVSMI